MSRLNPKVLFYVDDFGFWIYVCMSLVYTESGSTWEFFVLYIME